MCTRLIMELSGSHKVAIMSQGQITPPGITSKRISLSVELGLRSQLRNCQVCVKLCVIAHGLKTRLRLEISDRLQPPIYTFR